MKISKLGPVVVLLALAGCADVLGLETYEGTTSTGGGGGTTSAGGSGGTTSAGGSGGGGTTSTGGSGGTTSTGTTTASTSTTTTVTPECEPATSEPCYGGPPLTEGIGACEAGKRTCDAAGQWGACVGDVTPKIEACSTPDVDESCDNLAKCAGAFRWARRFGGALDQAPGLPAVGADGSLHLTGAATGALDFGGGDLLDGGGKDIFLARLDRDGKHLWSKRFGGPGDQSGVAVAVDPSGNVVLIGTAAGTLVDAGGGVLPVAGATDILIAKYAPDGAHLWSRTLGGALADTAGALAVDAAGFVHVVGTSDTAAGSELFLARLSPEAGATEWSQVFPVSDAQTATVTGLAAAANGDLVLVGFGKGAPDFGGAALPKPAANDVFAARFTAAGAHLWSHAYGGAGDDYAYGVALDVAGNAAFVGHTQGPFAFGAPLPAATAAGAFDLAVWRVKPDGTTDWGFLVGDAGNQFGFGIAVDALGNVVLSGTFSGALTFEKTLTAVDPFDRFVAKLAPDGAPIWSQRFLNGAGSLPRVAADPLGNIAYVSLLIGATDLGGGPLTSTSQDIVAASFAP